MNAWIKQISKLYRHKCQTKHKNVAYTLGGVNFGSVKIKTSRITKKERCQDGP